MPHGAEKIGRVVLKTRRGADDAGCSAGLTHLIAARFVTEKEDLFYAVFFFSARPR